MSGEIVLCRNSNGDAIVNIPHKWRYHSPTGFGWGYAGSGPADLALNILLYCGCSREKSFEMHQEFKRDFIVGIPYDGGTIAVEAVKEWVGKHANMDAGKSELER